MSTLLELCEGVAKDLRDPDGKTFDSPTLRDLVNAAQAELNIVSPLPMLETITPLEGVYEYPTRIIYPRRLELWDHSLTPQRVVARVVHVSENPVASSEAGWELWNGNLRISYGTLTQIDPAKHDLRLWGWGPRLRLNDLTQASELTDDLEWLVREGAVSMGYERLVNDRSLFTQWQTLPGNNDISPTQLTNAADRRARLWQDHKRGVAIIRALG